MPQAGTFSEEHHYLRNVIYEIQIHPCTTVFRPICDASVPSPGVLRYLKYTESLHAATTGKNHMVEFKCGSLVDSSLPLLEKRAMCEQPLNPTVAMLEAACRSVAARAGVAEGVPFVTTHAIGGCYLENGLAQFSSERPTLTYTPPAGVERLGAVFSLAEALTHQKFGIPRPDNAMGAFMAMADWTTLLNMANAAPVSLQATCLCLRFTDLC